MLLVKLINFVNTCELIIGWLLLSIFSNYGAFSQ